jgi:hypothetical protein
MRPRFIILSRALKNQKWPWRQAAPLLAAALLLVAAPLACLLRSHQVSPALASYKTHKPVFILVLITVRFLQN